MINIAIDGPAGAGKSTIAKAVAKDLGIIYLDTGAMYRATAYLALQNGIDVKDEEKVAEMLEDLTMDIKYDENGAQRIASPAPRPRCAADPPIACRCSWACASLRVILPYARHSIRNSMASA